jgi:hypothetical protein
MIHDERWLAWAAGILDGEGCIYIARFGKSRGSWSLWVSVTNTDTRMLAKLQDLFGGSIAGPYQPNPQRKPYRVWGVASRQAGQLLAAVRPWLVAKADQADIALEFRAHIVGQGQRNPGLREVAEAARESLRRLKRGGSHARPAIPDRLEGRRAAKAPA